MLAWQERFPRSATSGASARCSRSSSSATRRRRSLPPELAAAVVEEALDRGLLLLKAGLYGNCIRVLCPLTIADAELEEALAVWDEALTAALSA